MRRYIFLFILMFGLMPGLLRAETAPNGGEKLTEREIAEVAAESVTGIDLALRNFRTTYTHWLTNINMCVVGDLSGEVRQFFESRFVTNFKAANSGAEPPSCSEITISANPEASAALARIITLKAEYNTPEVIRPRQIELCREINKLIGEFNNRHTRDRIVQQEHFPCANLWREGFAGGFTSEQYRAVEMAPDYNHITRLGELETIIENLQRSVSPPQDQEAMDEMCQPIQDRIGVINRGIPGLNLAYEFTDPNGFTCRAPAVSEEEAPSESDELTSEELTLVLQGARRMTFRQLYEGIRLANVAVAGFDRSSNRSNPTRPQTEAMRRFNNNRGEVESTRVAYRDALIRILREWDDIENKARTLSACLTNLRGDALSGNGVQIRNQINALINAAGNNVQRTMVGNFTHGLTVETAGNFGTAYNKRWPNRENNGKSVEVLEAIQEENNRIEAELERLEIDCSADVPDVPATVTVEYVAGDNNGDVTMPDKHDFVAGTTNVTVLARSLTNNSSRIFLHWSISGCNLEVPHVNPGANLRIYSADIEENCTMTLTAVWEPVANGGTGV